MNNIEIGIISWNPKTKRANIKLELNKLENTSDIAQCCTDIQGAVDTAFNKEMKKARNKKR